jgi:hypothetical protein
MVTSAGSCFASAKDFGPVEQEHNSDDITQSA